MKHRDITIELPNQKIAAKIWGEEDKLPVLALHGWLDNAATFDRIAPLLPDIQLIAIDLPGHGHSSHKPDGTFLHFIDLVIDCILVTNHLKLKKFALLGHSLGAAIASIIAGTIPKQILGVALIDGLGPLTTPALAAPVRLAHFIETITQKTSKRTSLYEDPKEAVAARVKATPIAHDSAALIVNRGLKKSTDNQWTWRTDPRLMIPTALEMTEEQVLAFLQQITAPVFIIRPDEGYPFPADIIKNRLAVLKKVTVREIPGYHHVHLDSPKTTAHTLAPFFAALKPSKE